MCASVRPSERISRIASLAGIAAITLCSITGCGTGSSNPSSTSQGSGASGSSSSNTAPAGNVSRGAQLGMVWSPSDKTLRPIVGVPGSSWLGASVVPAGAYEYAAYSSASGVALLTDSAGNLTLLSSPASQPVTLAQGAPTKASIVFSPSGTRAAVFAAGASSALLVSGLPSQPGVTPLHSTTAIQAMAIGDDGSVLIASPGSAGISVTQISSGGTRSTLASLAGFGGMALLPGSDDVLLADSARNTLVLLHNGTSKTLATQADGLSQPLAVAASADGLWAITANAADGTLVRVSLSGSATTTRALCACRPSELLPLAGNAVFELTQPGTSPSWLIDAGRKTPSVFFIPPAHSTTGSNQ